jgi:hypothetical protein
MASAVSSAWRLAAVRPLPRFSRRRTSLFRAVPGVREWIVKDWFVGDKGFGGKCRLGSGIRASSWADISLSVMVV